MRSLRFLVVAMVLGAMGSAASAALFFEDFESYDAGEFLHDPAGWKGWDDTAGAGAPVSDAHAFSGTKSIEIVPAADLVHSYSVAGGKWVFTAMQYIPSGGSGTTYFILMNQYDSGRDWSIQTQFNEASGVITPWSGVTNAATVIFDEWVQLKYVIDLDENTVEEYYGGVHIDSRQWDDNQHGTLEAIDLYGNNASSVFYDDIKIQSYQSTLTGADNPSPADQAVDVPRDTVLEWTPGVYAATHNVYFDADYDAVADGTVPTAAGLVDTSFDPGRLEFSQTYYWRVDEVNAAPDSTVFKGDVLSFTAEPYSVQIPGDAIVATASSIANEFSPAERTIDGSGLDGDTHSTSPEDMWFTATPEVDPWIQYEFSAAKKLDTMKVWNSNGAAEMALGWGAKDVVIEYSVDGENWEVLADANQLSRAPGLATYDTYDNIAFGGVAARMVRIKILNNWGGILPSFSISEVQFYEIPTAAREPDPADGSENVLPNAIATWRAGRDAGQHTIYLSTDPNAVADGSAPSVSSSTSSLDLSEFDLELEVTYYWRVDEVNEAEATPVWAGPVWSFTTTAELVVDDFESYGNLSPDRPFQTWLDGFGYSADEYFPNGYEGNGTGAGIGHDIWTLTSPHYDGDIMETADTLPDSGQSMPLYYTNTGGVSSETQRKFSVPQDWTVGGATLLSIPFSGMAGNTGTLYAKINGVKVTYPRDPANLEMTGWVAFNIDLTSMNVQNVTELAIGVDGSGASGMLLIDDITLHSAASQVVTPTEPDTANLMVYLPLDGTSQDASGNNRHGTATGGPIYVAGAMGQALEFDGVDDYVNVNGYKGINADDTDPANVVQQAFTISNWVNTTSDSGDTEMVTWGASSGSATRLTWRIHEGRVRTEHNAGNLRGNTYVNDGEWHHVALVVTEGANLRPENTKLYVDGFEDSTFSGDDDTYKLVAEHDVRIGMSGPQNGRYFPGALDEVRIYDAALAPAEILWLAGWTEPVDAPF